MILQKLITLEISVGFLDVYLRRRGLNVIEI
jgi:hypothetical protein